MADRHPEVRAEIAAIEEAMEAYALANPTRPSAGLYAGIRDRIQNGNTAGSTSGPAARWLTVALAVLSVVLGVLYWNATQSRAAEVESLRRDYQQLEQDCAEQQERNQQIIYAWRDTAVSHVVLRPTPIAGEALAVVHWNESTGNTLLEPISLPVPPAGKQYQLWAIVDGQPTDMGVFDLPAEAGDIVTVDRSVPRADAFAITLEDAGGRPQPNLDQLYVIGNTG